MMSDLNIPTTDDTATAYANVRAFAEAFMAHCPGDLIRSIDPDPDDDAVWPVRLKLTELLAVLDEYDARTMRSEGQWRDVAFADDAEVARGANGNGNEPREGD